MSLNQAAIFRFRQFRDVHLDFRDPATGKPLEKICFLGPNGTGKSTLLKCLTYLCDGSLNSSVTNLFGFDFDNQGWTAAEFSESGKCVRISPGNASPFGFFKSRGENFTEVCEILKTHYPGDLTWDHPEPGKVYFCPPEAEHSPDSTFMQSATLDRAFNDNPEQSVQLIHQGTLTAFWASLIRRVKERERAYLEFLDSVEDTLLSEAKKQFEASNPKILETLANLWDRILAPMGLEFDIEKATIPVQLRDTFNAYVRLKSTKQPLPWSDLSTGIRHFLFRLGHIQTLLFQQPSDEPVYLFVDEPEASLHPEFLYDLVAIYREIAPTAQIFMATHSPIIAAQFRPEERFRLEMDEDGGVKILKGISPEGDDPNDILKNDFGVSSLNGAKGEEMWERFLELRRLMKKEPDATRRGLLAEEYATIGSNYNFSVDA